MIKAIYIAGMHRSGTTLLTFILGTNPDCVAVGEVYELIRPDADPQWVEDHYNRCSCCHSEQMLCRFWPDVMETIKAHNAQTLSERYAVVTSVFARHFPGKIMVDSSKFIESYQALAQHSYCKAVLMFRDVRGWSVSTGQLGRPKSLLSWLRRNKEFESKLIDSVRTSYEAVARYPEQAVPRLCEQLGLQYNPNMLSINTRDNHHVMVGNRMRNGGTLAIEYDQRWSQQDSLWNQVMIPVMNYNQRVVYNPHYLGQPETQPFEAIA